MASLVNQCAKGNLSGKWRTESLAIRDLLFVRA
jgi:hypothetical protein